MNSKTALLSTILVLLLLLTQAAAHGLISWPRQRGLLGQNNYGLKLLLPDAPVDYCPHCLNGGGAGSIKQHIPDQKWRPYEPTNLTFPFRDDHGLCGDPKGRDDHMAGGRFYIEFTIATYEQGDYIDVEAHVSAHHNGYFEFFACSLDCCGGNDLSKKCFTEHCCQKMLRVPHQSCESGHDRICGPIDPRYPSRWYLPPRDIENPEDNWYGGLNKKMRYALPGGMTCEKCLIHWAWTTANSCNPPGYAEYKFPSKWQGIPGDGGSVGGINRSFATCGDDDSSFPEEFWSCSENVRIVKKNGGLDRTSQTFHNGDTDIEGPENNTSSQPTQPMKEPIMVPVDEPGGDNPSPSPNSSLGPTSAPTSTSTSTTIPPRTTVVTDGIKGQNETEIQRGELPMESSSYDLSLYISSYDSGTCLAKDGYKYCQACLDLGFGVTKCFWCRRNSDGEESCLHQKP